MTGVRANWNLAEAVAATPDDPFEAVVYTEGAQIDLTASETELAAQLMILCAMETELGARGITCPLKSDGQSCQTCTVATLDPSRRRSALCRVGKDQETVWQAGDARVEVRMGPVRIMAAVAEEMSELGHISDELAELAVAAGF